MLVSIPNLLDADQVAHCRATLAAAPWVDGRVTAGAQSAKAKRNLQVAEDEAAARALGELILTALGRNPTFLSAALPLKVFPPLFNRYEAGMGFGAHVDNAVRFVGETGARLRTDLSCTLFLSDATDYDGGELVIEDTFGEHAVKGEAGELVVYPGASLHRVEPISRGSRLAAVFWVQSMVRRDDQRTLLHRLDDDVIAARGALGDRDPTVLSLTAGYHNLLRMWADA
ncbi:MAG TPA: Fe2+-dependent dioxygenase [Caulobacteraceae bacterium]|jgi:PKHD-type hydroxylase